MFTTKAIPQAQTGIRVPSGYKSVNRLYTQEATIVMVGNRYRPKLALQPGMCILVEDSKIKDCTDDAPTHEIVFCITNDRKQGLVLKSIKDGSTATIEL